MSDDSTVPAGDAKVPPFANGTSAVDEESTADLTPAPVQPGFAFDRSDIGFADYLAQLFGRQIRYDHSRNRWLVWEGHRWREDSKGRVREAAQTAARRQLDEARRMPKGTTDENGKLDKEAQARRDAIKWALRQESRASRESMLATVRDREPISVNCSDEGWDSNDLLLGTPNGVVDLRTGQLRAGDQENDRITLNTAIEFDPSAACPRWEKFVDEVFHYPELVTYGRRAIGYTLTGDVREDCWFGTSGEGENGKSTMLRVLYEILGDYAHAAPFSVIQQGDGRRFQVAYLQFKRLVIMSESSRDSTIDDAMLKQLTGKDPIPAEWKHGRSFDFMPSHKLWFMFNNKPNVKDNSHGFWRRARIIPFTQRFDPNADRNLKQTLRSEMPGILAWMVRACLEWQREGLQAPAIVQEASGEYKESQDPLHEFVSQHLRRVQPSRGAPSFTLKEALATYLDWARRENITRPFGRKNFAAMLEERGFPAVRSTTGSRAFYGVLVAMCVCKQTPCACFGRQP